MCAMNSWLLYDKEGRCAYIPYGINYTPWGVLIQAGAQPANEYSVIYLNDMGGGNIAFCCQRQYWASARDDRGSVVQFQSPNGDWIYSPQADEMFRAVPSGDGYFVLFSNHIGHYVSLPYSNTDNKTYVMVALASFADATRFYAVSVNDPPRPVVFDFLDLYNNASGLSFTGVELVNRNVSSANLSNCDLTGVTSLSGCNLNGADLQQAKLTGLHLAGASLSATNFTSAQLNNCVFANLAPPTEVSIVQSVTPYAQGDGGSGIEGCPMSAAITQGFAFDFDSSGNLDHLVFYCSGNNVASQKALYIIKSNGNNTYTTRYSANSIGEFDLTDPKHPNVQGFAFDFEGSGKLDHLVFYCPGTGIVYIFKSNGDGDFTQRYPTSANPVGTGIGGFDLVGPMDRGFAFDYEGKEGESKLNYLVFFRATRGAIYIMKSNGNGTFTTVYSEGDLGADWPPSPGIGGCQFLDPNTRGFAFDLTGSGNLDHLVFCYPSQNSVYVIQNQGGTFTTVCPNAANPGGSPALPGFALNDQHIRGFAYDFEGSGKQDYLVCYDPGQRTAVFCKANKQADGTVTFSQSYYTNQGIGGYDLAYGGDLAFPFDYEGTGKLDYITLFRPGHGAVFITKQRLVTGLYPILEQAQLQEATFSSPMPGVQLAGANLAGATLDCDLSGADLSGGVVLTGATITANCDLTGANLAGAQMAGVDLTKVKSIRNANLAGADLTGAKLQGVDLTGTNLAGTKLCNTDLTQTTFSSPIVRSTDAANPTSFANSTLPYAVIGLDWSYLDLVGTTLVGMPTDLSGLKAASVNYPNGDFVGYILNQVDFSAATLTGGLFSQAHLDTANFNEAVMNNTSFNNAYLNQVTFSSATLGGENQVTNSQFTRAYISSCDFSDANLYGVAFTNATLDSSNKFSAGANLELADFSGAYLVELDFTSANLQGANFNSACMVGVILADADLSPGQNKAIEASLVGAFLQGAQFTGTNLGGVNLESAVLSNTTGTIQQQHYDDSGNLTLMEPLPYRGHPFPVSSCFNDQTLCPNGYTYGYNTQQGLTIAQMMTLDNPPTQWTPPKTKLDS